MPIVAPSIASLLMQHTTQARHWHEKAASYKGRASCRALHEQAARIAAEHDLYVKALMLYAAEMAA